MEKDARIYVAGHRGLVGSSLVRQLRAQGYDNLLLRTHAELDLTDGAAVAEFFAAERPDHVLLAAPRWAAYGPTKAILQISFASTWQYS